MEQEEEILTREVLVEKFPLYIRIDYNKNHGNWWYSHKMNDVLTLRESFPVRMCENEEELRHFFIEGFFIEKDEDGKELYKKKITNREIYILDESICSAGLGKRAILKEHCK